MGTFPPDKKGWLTSMTLHDLITLMILPIGTSGTNEIQYIKYTSEYILNLQIHQQYYEERAKQLYELRSGTMSIKELNSKFLILL